MIEVPYEIRTAIRMGATFTVSISGGKDSQAMLRLVTDLARAEGWIDQVIARHADLGRAEWHQTPAFVEQCAAKCRVPLVIVRRNDGRDLLDHITNRADKLAGTGRVFWPSSSQRYCTSDLKRAPLDQHSRLYRIPVSVQGLRAEESPGRAAKEVVSLNRNISAKRLRDMDPVLALCARLEKERVALVWYPIHTFTVAEVWEACGTSTEELERRRALYRSGDEDAALAGWPCHPAYVFGNQRLSCSLCILATKNDLANGARHNPEYFEALVALERKHGSTFKHKFALSQLEGN